MREEVKEGLNEGGFSGAGAADDGDLFAGGDGEGDVFEDGGCSGWRMVLELGDVRGCGRGKGLTHSSKQRSRI